MFVKVKELMKNMCRMYMITILMFIFLCSCALFDVLVLGNEFTSSDTDSFLSMMFMGLLMNTIALFVLYVIEKDKEANLTVEELEKIYVVVEDGSEFKDGYVQVAKKIINSKHGEDEKIVFPMDEEVVVWCYNKLNKTVVFGYYSIEKNGVLERHEYVFKSIIGDGYEFTIDGEIIYQDLELYKLHYKQVLLKRGIEYKE